MSTRVGRSPQRRRERPTGCALYFETFGGPPAVREVPTPAPGPDGVVPAAVADLTGGGAHVSLDTLGAAIT